MMKKTSSKSKSKVFDKFISVLSILLFAVFWYLGGDRSQHNQQAQLSYLTLQSEQLEPAESNTFQGMIRSDNESNLVEWISVGSGIGYGGEMVAGINISPTGILQALAIFDSKETSTYLDKVMQSGVADGILGQNIDTNITFDSVTGATLTSTALMDAVEHAAKPVREQIYGYTLSESKSIFSSLQWLDLVAFVFFGVAVWASRTRNKKKVMINWVVLIISMGVFGFYSATLYTASTMGMVISGAWLYGFVNYTPLILILLSIVYILYYNRNVYCQNICPFGAVQQCLAKVGNAKSSTIKNEFLLWFPRVLLLTTLCLGAYFRNPVAFSYEPFGIMFGMIGTMYLFVLTIVILLTSLVVRRPWCQTLCPINAMTDFLTFNKSWFKQIQKKRAKQHRQQRKQTEDGQCQSKTGGRE